MAVTKIRGRGKAGARAASRSRRHLRVRKKVTGSAARPRLAVNRSARHIFAQLVDDGAGRTLVSASTLEADVRAAAGDKKARAHRVGQLLASRAKEAGITAARFHPGGYAHPRPAAAPAPRAPRGRPAVRR